MATNADKIRQMTDEELVSFLDDYCVISQFCPSDDTDCMGETDCARCWLKWLQEEATDDDDTDCMGETDCARCWLKWLQEEATDD